MNYVALVLLVISNSLVWDQVIVIVFLIIINTII